MAVGTLTASRVNRQRAGHRIPVVPVVATAVVGLRLLLVDGLPSSDEGGYLVVASQWSGDGSSLYSDHWVDRPPLLLGLYRLADLAGGLVALRVIGALAAAATVVLLAAAARRAFGPSASGWTAVVAAALLVSPLFGSMPVDGELLAAPFTALGVWLAVEALHGENLAAVRAAALGAGVAAALALLVKQNMADVVVFALVCWIVAWRTGTVTGRRCTGLVALAAAGAVAGYAAVTAWAWSRGASPLGVFEATYPFRLDAARMLASGASNFAGDRLGNLGTAALLSGAALVLVAFVRVAVRRTRPAPVVWAVVALGAYATASILVSGSYWLHYLVQAVPAVALAAGALSTLRGQRETVVIELLTSAVVASAAVSLAVTVIHPPPAPGNVVGNAVAASARPGDTVLSAFGGGEIVYSSGLTSPYPHLWSLPSRIRDPDLTLLRRVLAGPDAPTWLVMRGTGSVRRLAAHGLLPMIEERYRVVGSVCGRTVHLQRGVDRAPLEATGRCDGLVLP